MYTLGQAARATGKSKPTIMRAIKGGRLSAKRSNTGAYIIDPEELSLVYPATGNGNGTATPPETPVSDEHLTRLLQQYEETIRDLRARLDASEAERRALQRPWWRKWR